MDEKVTTHETQILDKKRELTMAFIEECKKLNDEDLNNENVVRYIASLIETTGRHFRNLDTAFRVLEFHENDFRFVEKLKYL